jgi:hypothetical protein
MFPIIGFSYGKYGVWICIPVSSNCIGFKIGIGWDDYGDYSRIGIFLLFLVIDFRKYRIEMI